MCGPVRSWASQEKEAEKDGETALDVRKRKRLERDPLHQGLIVERSHLKGREYQIDLAARLGKTQVRARVHLRMHVCELAGCLGLCVVGCAGAEPELAGVRVCVCLPVVCAYVCMFVCICACACADWEGRWTQGWIGNGGSLDAFVRYAQL